MRVNSDFQSIIDRPVEILTMERNYVVQNSVSPSVLLKYFSEVSRNTSSLYLQVSRMNRTTGKDSEGVQFTSETQRNRMYTVSNHRIFGTRGIHVLTLSLKYRGSEHRLHFVPWLSPTTGSLMRGRVVVSDT